MKQYIAEQLIHVFTIHTRYISNHPYRNAQLLARINLLMSIRHQKQYTTA